METLGVAAIMFLAALTQGALGFGSGLVAMGLLPLVVPSLFAIPLVAIYSLAIAALIAWRVRAHLCRERILPLLIGCLAGVPLGLLFLGEVDPRWVVLALGIFLVAYSLWALFFARRLHERRVSDRWAYAFGLVSGLLGGAFNTGGPPLIVWVTLKGWGKDAATSTLQALFAFTGTVSIVGHIAAGRLDAEVALTALIVAPAATLGVLVGGRLYHRINQETFRAAVLALLLVVGLVFIQKATHIL